MPHQLVEITFRNFVNVPWDSLSSLSSQHLNCRLCSKPTPLPGYKLAASMTTAGRVVLHQMETWLYVVVVQVQNADRAINKHTVWYENNHTFVEAVGRLVKKFRDSGLLSQTWMSRRDKMVPLLPEIPLSLISDRVSPLTLLIAVYTVLTKHCVVYLEQFVCFAADKHTLSHF